MTNGRGADVRGELGFEVRLSGPYDRAHEEVVAALKERGFGILTRIDVKEAFREKLGIEFRDYAILGACNPGLAHRALSAHSEVGLLLPCNVTVEAGEDGSVIVRIADPAIVFAASGLERDDEMNAVIGEARALLEEVAEALSA